MHFPFLVAGTPFPRYYYPLLWAFGLQWIVISSQLRWRTYIMLTRVVRYSNSFYYLLFL